MHSPKFPSKAKDLRDVINVSRLKLMWKNKVREAMRRQPIPDPLEHLDFHVRIEANCVTIESEILSATYLPRSPIRFLAEKSKGLCRQLVIPSVKDALILQTLSDALWAEIKMKAPTKKSFFAPEDHQFSQNIRGHSSEYGPVAAWLAFQRAIFGFSRSKKFIVVTDIANYYDSISYDHLRNILADFSLAREHSIDLLIYMLSCMLWQPDYMPKISVGLPQIHLDAPRLLAHTFLFEIDGFLSEIKGADFARFMDDIDIGVDSLPEARKILRDLDLALQTRQIRLNSGKTKILSEQEARIHFRIRENILLDRLADKIDAKMKGKLPLQQEQRKIEYALRAGLRRGVFSVGNGEKILKRLINLARRTKVDIPPAIFSELLRDWVGVRALVLSWWQFSVNPETKLHLIAELLESGHLVDDAALMNLAVSLVIVRLPKTPAVESTLERITNCLNETSAWGFYAKVWIFSKYGTADKLMSVIERTVSLWTTQECLSRLVAGQFPRFWGTPIRTKFEAILRRNGNLSSGSVVEFHHELVSHPSGYTSVRRFIDAPNPSLPNLISHSKFLMLLSLLNNPTIAPTAVSQLKRIHKRALSDPYYAAL